MRPLWLLLVLSAILVATCVTTSAAAIVVGQKKLPAPSLAAVAVAPVPFLDEEELASSASNDHVPSTSLSPPPVTVTSGPTDTFPLAIFSTPVGEIILRLRPDAAPLTVSNFIGLIESGFYNNGSYPNNNGNGTTFYRYEAGFVLQGGNMNGPSTRTVPLEYNLPNARWTVGLARDSDPNSGSSEFFINLADNTNTLCPPNNAYAVFAEVISGKAGAIRVMMSRFPTVDEDGIHFFQSPMPAILSARVVYQNETGSS